MSVAFSENVFLYILGETIKRYEHETGADAANTSLLNFFRWVEEKTILKPEPAKELEENPEPKANPKPKPKKEKKWATRSVASTRNRGKSKRS